MTLSLLKMFKKIFAITLSLGSIKALEADTRTCAVPSKDPVSLLDLLVEEAEQSAADIERTQG